MPCMDSHLCGLLITVAAAPLAADHIAAFRCAVSTSFRGHTHVQFYLQY